MSLPTERHGSFCPARALPVALLLSLMLPACGPSTPPLMKRVEDASAPPPRVPIVVAVPRPGGSADAAAPATAPAPARSLPPPAAPPVPDPSVIYFGRDRYQVDEAYAPLLQAHAKRLLADPALMLRIDAFTDESGPSDYNLELSRMRAQMVLRELRALGVPARQMQVVGHGPGRGGKGATRAHASARRVELSYR
jgi:peptidoglycan-associated lipoprotein